MKVCQRQKQPQLVVISIYAYKICHFTLLIINKFPKQFLIKKRYILLEYFINILS